MAATNRMIGVTRKCFKDSGLLDVLGLPVEASSFALTSVLRLESAHSPSTCAESPRPRLGASLLLGWCLGWVGIGGGTGTRWEDETHAAALLGVFVGTEDVWGRD